MMNQQFILCFVTVLSFAIQTDKLSEGDPCGSPPGSMVYMRENGIMKCQNCPAHHYYHRDTYQCRQCEGPFTNYKENLRTSCQDDIRPTSADDAESTKKDGTTKKTAPTPETPTGGVRDSTIAYPTENGGENTSVVQITTPQNDSIQEHNVQWEIITAVALVVLFVILVVILIYCYWEKIRRFCRCCENTPSSRVAYSQGRST